MKMLHRLSVRLHRLSKNKVLKALLIIKRPIFAYLCMWEAPCPILASHLSP